MASEHDQLTQAQLQELRSEIERELRKLERGMDGVREATRTVELDQTVVGRLSRIDALQNQQMSAGLHERDASRHALLLTALTRMDEGTYGQCERCGGAIPFGRLLVMPEAGLCATCGGA